jgi:hypothetical protein
MRIYMSQWKWWGLFSSIKPNLYLSESWRSCTCVLWVAIVPLFLRTLELLRQCSIFYFVFHFYEETLLTSFHHGQNTSVPTFGTSCGLVQEQSTICWSFPDSIHASSAGVCDKSLLIRITRFNTLQSGKQPPVCDAFSTVTEDPAFLWHRGLNRRTY